MDAEASADVGDQSAAHQRASYRVSDGLEAGAGYSLTRASDTANNDELQEHLLDVSTTAPAYDVLNLGLNWNVSDRSAIGIGYQLQSRRPRTYPEVGGVEPSSLVPQSEAIDHAVTFGVRRSWGGAE